MLNADTKRSAVEEFLRESSRRGPDSPWYVVANRRGVANKVVFREGRTETPGWYMYTRTPLKSVTAI